MRKSLDEQPTTSVESKHEVSGTVEVGSGDVGRKELVEVCKGTPEKGVRELWADDPPKPPKGSSITLDGSGDHSGRDGWNSMSLADFYKVMLYGDHGRKL